MSRALHSNIEHVQFVTLKNIPSAPKSFERVVAVVEWSPTEDAVTLQVRFDDDPEGVTQTLHFGATDAAGERGRSAGLWLGSVIDSHLTQFHPESKPSAKQTQHADARLAVANPAWRLGASMIGTVPSPAQTLGVQLTLGWAPVVPFWIQVLGGTRRGSIAEGWSKWDSWVGVGFAWRMNSAAPGATPEMSLRTDLLGAVERVSEPPAEGGAARTRTLPLGRLELEAGWRLPHSLGIFGAAGGETGFGTLRVRRASEASDVVKIPAFRGVGELGLRWAW